MKKDIIFYSNYCTYSKEVINQISKTPINDNIIYISVDDENIELPPFIKAVPTIYLVNDKKIVVDEEIEQWIKEKTSKPIDDTIQPYFGSTDNSYSTLNDKEENKPFISSYTFLGEEQKIETPKSDSDSGSNSGSRSNSGSNSGSRSNSSNSKAFNMEQLQKERQSEFKPIQRN